MAKVEEAEVNAYMEAEGEAPTEQERVRFLRQRYADTKEAYRALKLHKQEADGKGDAAQLDKLTALFRENYKARRYVVTELRRAGEEVEDPFIPKSAN